MRKRPQSEITNRPMVAVVATGGTIASLAVSTLDTLDYPDGCAMLDAKGVTELLPKQAHELFDVQPIPFSSVVSTRIGPEQWLALATIVVVYFAPSFSMVMTHVDKAQTDCQCDNGDDDCDLQDLNGIVGIFTVHTFVPVLSAIPAGACATELAVVAFVAS